MGSADRDTTFPNGLEYNTTPTTNANPEKLIHFHLLLRVILDVASLTAATPYGTSFTMDANLEHHDIPLPPERKNLIFRFLYFHQHIKMDSQPSSTKESPLNPDVLKSSVDNMFRASTAAVKSVKSAVQSQVAKRFVSTYAESVKSLEGKHFMSIDQLR
jgi:hypothetical protein